MKAKSLTIVSLLAAMLAAVSWAQATGADKAPQLAAAPVTHLAVGTVKSVDAARRSLTIDHQAIASLNMPAMTMPFRLPEASQPSIAAGQSIAFTFTAGTDGLTIQSVQPVNLAARTDAKPGMKHEDMPGMAGMKGMMESCHSMMGGR